MYPILILREELVCLITLLFLLFTARFYPMGKDSSTFHRLTAFAIVHVIFDALTVWTVNHMATEPAWLNTACHIVFYMSGLLFACELFNYIIRLCYPNVSKKLRIAPYLLPVVYVAMLPFLNVEYVEANGTYSSAGIAAYVGYGLAFLFILAAFFMVLINFRKLSTPIKCALVPMMLVLIVTETVQVVVRELLFTGGAITIVTVGFFFSLENPIHVFRQKLATDALTGVRSRHSFDEDIARMEKAFSEKRDNTYIFAFCDINNLRSCNRLYGHQEGDRYIIHIASTLVRVLKEADAIYRMGGDEFLAVYSQVGEKTAAAELDRAQKACFNTDDDRAYETSIAIGYAVSGPEYATLSEVIHTADYIMYQNKEAMKSAPSGETRLTGTRLNLTGLTDRMFNAMAYSNERSYPFVTNLNTNVTRISANWVDFFDLSGEFIQNFPDLWIGFIHPNDRQAFSDELNSVLNDDKRYLDCEFRALAPNGEYVVCDCHGAVYHGKDEEADIFAGYMVNHGIEERVDAVTGLPNFLAMDDVVQDTLDKGQKAVILKLSLNNLSRINMLYGYSNGDDVVKRIAVMLQDEIGENGDIFCQDSSNFSFFIPGKDREWVTRFYNHLTHRFEHGIDLGSASVPLSISGGAIELYGGCGYTRKMIRSNLLYALDESTYMAHRHIVFFEKPGEEEDGALYLLREILTDAVASQQYFRFRYQPIVDTGTGSIKGAEALLRWVHPVYGEVSPSRFIGFLENDPCYYALGLNLLRGALGVAKDMRRLIPDFRINVNITVLQLQNPEFLNNVSAILKEFDYPPQGLVLELTERCKELDTAFLDRQISLLRGSGIAVALDDMGTGYSTISLLMEIRVDEIKLDRDFVCGMRENSAYRLLVDALMKGSAAGYYEVCFEGVEDARMLQDLRVYGNSLAQGYYFSRPVFPPDLIALAEKQNKNH